jgi:hypothetical protein
MAAILGPPFSLLSLVTICNRLRFTAAGAQDRKFESNNRSQIQGKRTDLP